MVNEIKKNEKIAIISLVCGILGVLLIFVRVPFLYLMAIVPSILAIVLGRKAKKKIKNSDGKLKGEGIATAGFVLGIIGIILVVLALILMGVLLSMLLK